MGGEAGGAVREERLLRWQAVIRNGITASLYVCLLAGMPAAGAQGDPTPYYGKRIAAVLFEPAEQPLTRDQLGLIVQIRPGDTLEETALSKAIERLWATLRYTEIAVEAEAGAEGVALTFRTAPTFFISRVTVTGAPEPPNPAQLVNTAKMPLGEAFDEEMLPKAAENLRELLRANGFRDAQVRHATERRTGSEEVDVQFFVEAGRRARYGKPEFAGNVQLQAGKLIQASGWLKWRGVGGYQEVTASRTQRGIEKVRDAYIKADYLQASVRLAGLEYEPATFTMTPRIQVDAGPRVFVRAEGARVGKGTLRNLVPVYQERTVDRELLLEGERRVGAHFRNQGFFDAKVSHSVSAPAADGGQTIRYRVERGPRFRLMHVGITGNRYFDRKTVEERLGMIPARLPRWRRGVFNQEILSQDVNAVTELYRANGFRDVEVEGRIERKWKGKATDLAAFIEIKEGTQWFVSEVDLTGVDLKLLGEIRPLITSNPGQPFAIATVASDRDSVLNWYFNNGYPDATFDASVTPAGEAQRMKLRYAVREGRRNFVREVLVSGLRATRPALVSKRLALAPGEPLSQSSMVETQRRLYDLGIFAKVDVATQNPDGRERNKYVLLQVEEAKKYSFNLGFGAELGRIGGGGNNFDSPAGTTGFAPRGLIGLTRSNIFGLAHTASATLRASNIQQRLLVSYLAPQFLGNDNFNLTFSSLLDHSLDVRTYASTRTESSVQLGQKLGRTVSVQYRGTARFVFIDQGSLKIGPSLIPIYSQPVKTIAVSSSIVQERRDDPIDSHRGMHNVLDFGFAPAFSKSSTNYTRMVARNSTYHPVRKEVTFARSTNFGWLHNLGNSPVPLPENFYAGGASTHRGFPDNQAGPRDKTTGFPVGGGAFLFFQQELRFPLIGRTVGMVVFHDMGNVYTTLDALSVRYKQRDRQDFDYMVQAAGIGFRLKTPVGPMRLDFAYAPNSPRFVGFVGTRDDLIHGTGTYNVPMRVNPFQFHFSIGQAF
ncbi:MAG: BamA/TamA family outer membrane protein [Candidatus Solibacter usitatus]|nr:BamA/TamA family outer membrane protein [Candidatus Solibacter usitatus]